MIPFNRPTFNGRELEYLAQSVANGHTSGNGEFTQQAEQMLERILGSGTVLLTTSCTHALEMSARLLDLRPGDEIIVPSYTFVSTASAFTWNGARPVFADVRPDTLNMDLDSASKLISDRTRAICTVHYAGVGAEPDSFAELAKQAGILLIEDNAHGLGGTYKGRSLGTFGTLSTLSFHETKNITCGEGGALVVNDPALVERAEILREKGTDRSRFLRGQVDKYTWVDVGSSWVLSDLLAAVLVGQLERFAQIQQARHDKWDAYAQSLGEWALINGVLLPEIPDSAEHTSHMFHLRLPDQTTRDLFIAHMYAHGVSTVFHYQSLHRSPVGSRLGESHRSCPQSDAASSRLVRLPLFESLTNYEQAHVISSVLSFRSPAEAVERSQS